MPTYLIEGNAKKMGLHQTRDSNIIQPLNSVDILLIVQEPFKLIRKHIRYRMHIRDVFNYKTKQRSITE